MTPEPAPAGSPPPPTLPPLRWGHQTGLWQPRTAAFWLYAILLVGCGLVVGLVQVDYAATAPVPWLLSWVLLLLYIVPVALIVRRLDLYEREPRSLVVAAFLWGGVVAIIFSSFANVAWGSAITRLFGAEFASEWSAALTAPVVEELYKVVGVVLIYLIARPELDDLMDGFVLGAAVGLGFAAVEDVDYFINEFGGTIGGVLEGFWVRVIASGLYGHVLYTGLAGIGVAYAVTRRGIEPLAKRLTVGLGLLLLAMLAHFFWNSPLLWRELPLLLATAAKGLPFLLVLVVALRLARRREHRWLAVALEREVDRAGLTREELAVLDDPADRRRAVERLTQASGPEAGRRLKELHRRQIDLSMVTTRVDRGDHPDLVRARNEVRALRDRLWSMPGVVEALGIPSETVERMRLAPEEVAWVPGAVTPAGLRWWTAPDPAQAPAGELPGGVPVMVVASSGAWAQVRAANGWTGWVDGRVLTRPRRTYWR